MAGPPSSARGRRVSFWAHQLTEYLLGLFLVVTSADLAPPARIPAVVAGVVVVAGAALTDGPLGAWPVLTRAAHRSFDFFAVATLAASPLLIRGVDAGTVVVAVGAAGLLAVVTRATDYVPPPRRPRRRRRPGPVAPTGAGPSRRSAPLSGAARGAGFLLGRAAAKGPRAAGRALGRMAKARDQDR